MKEHDKKQEFTYTDVLAFVQAAAEGSMPVLVDSLEKFDNNIINWSNNQSETALTACAYSGNLDVLTFLLEKGADYSLRNKNGETAYDIATRLEHTAAAQKLKESGKETAPPPYTPPQNPQIPTQEDIEHFIDAAAQGNVGKLAATLSVFGENILDCTSHTDNNTALGIAAFNNRETVVSYLLEAGANMNIGVITTGITPLMAAVIDNSPHCMTLLLEAGADPFLYNEDGETAYDIAKRSHRTLLATQLQEWMSKPASLPYIPPENPPIPTQDDIEHFIDAGAEGNVSRLSFMLSTFGHAIIDRKSEAGGNTSLLLAAYNRKVAAVSFLLRSGANMDLGDESGCTPLMAACFIAPHSNISCITQLLEAGADIHACDSDGETVFDIVRKHGLTPEEKYLHSWLQRQEQNKLKDINMIHEGTTQAVVVTTKKLLLQKPRPTSMTPHR